MNKSVTISGIANLRREFQDIEDLLKSKKPMKGIVTDIKFGIIEKTYAGHDYLGRNFAPYSDAYKKKRSRMGLPTKPDLSVNGGMIAAIKAEVIEPMHGSVNVIGKPHTGLMTDALANVHNTGMKPNPKREFMNISDNGLRVLTKKHYDDPLLEIVRKYR